MKNRLMYCQNPWRNKDNQFTSFVIFPVAAKQRPSQGYRQAAERCRGRFVFLRKDAAQRQGLAAFHFHLGFYLLFIDSQRFAIFLLQHLARRIFANRSFKRTRSCCSTVGVTSIPSTASLNSTDVAPLSPLET
jgi:hypothetical protein